jgi:chemotaxis protein MotB
MPRIQPSGRAAAAFALLASVVAGCQSTGDTETIENQNRNLLGTVESEQRRIDELVTEKTELDRRVRQLEAQLAKLESAEAVVEEAKGEISAHVREMLERFRGDSDVEMERTDDGYRFVLREAVLYGSGSAELTPEGRQVLQRVADALSGGQHPVRIEGHTDDRPVTKEDTLQKFPRGNMELSVQRALAVWEYLVKDGRLDPRRVSVAGFGEHRPRVPNDSDRNRWRNRRVEIRVAEE